MMAAAVGKDEQRGLKGNSELWPLEVSLYPDSVVSNGAALSDPEVGEDTCRISEPISFMFNPSSVRILFAVFQDPT